MVSYYPVVFAGSRSGRGTSLLDTDRKLAAIDNSDTEKDNACSTLITDNINEPPNEHTARATSQTTIWNAPTVGNIGGCSSAVVIISWSSSPPTDRPGLNRSTSAAAASDDFVFPSLAAVMMVCQRARAWVVAHIS